MYVWHETKAPCTVQKDGREAKAPECCSQIAELSCMCACMNENAVSLQPADSMAASVLEGQLQPLPLCMYVTERYADDMLRAVLVMQVPVPPTHSVRAAVPRNYNKLRT